MARRTTRNAGSVIDPRAQRHHVVVLPFLRRPAQRLIMPSWVALTIGRWIFAWRPLTDAELAHELVHVRQWAEHGLLFIPRYLRASSAAMAAGGDRYHDNEFEVEARAAEASHPRRA